ncbi:sigma-54 dependent transcriptional regulator [Bosea sp. TWI1241]|uniref:sigma-54-dependent transcriptional regulator n=1 Tax=Bosea sp. TWI1241 TaxID=3148904 RepID=UPI0032096476
MSGDTVILVVEDDQVLGGALAQRLKLEGFEPVWAQDMVSALAAMRRRSPAFVLCDIRLPDGSGEDFYREAQSFLGLTPIVFATAYGEVEQAVRLVKAGADDYLTKPYDVDDLVGRIRARLRPVAKSRPAARPVAPSGAMTVLGRQLERAAGSRLPVLMTGETGVGKEVAARRLHEASAWSAEPFVAVNCGAIPKDLLESQFFGHRRGAFTGALQAHVGHFEEVGAGTLFLDEIGELDLRLQAALLRVLQDGRYRPVGAAQDGQFRGRIVAATNADLEQMRRDGRFRDDLFFRLSVLTFAIPPLRERLNEIMPLAMLFLDESTQDDAGEKQLSAEADTALMSHDWPGNVRELRNRIARACVMADGPVIGPGDLFPERRLADVPRPDLSRARAAADAAEIEKALAQAGGNLGEAAKLLGISRTTLWKRRSSGGVDR